MTSRYARGTYHPLHTEAYNLFNAMAHIAALSGAVFHVQRPISRFPGNAQTEPRGRGLDRCCGRCSSWRSAALTRAVQVATDEHRGIAAGLLVACGCFIIVNLIHLGSFLTHLYRYEHSVEPGPITRSAPGRRLTRDRARSRDSAPSLVCANPEEAGVR